MNIEYRRAEEQDLEGVNILLHKNFNHKLDNIINKEDKYNFVAIYNNEVVGHLFVTKIYNDIKKINWIKIDYLCVKEEYRGKGIATNLINNMEHLENDIDYYELTCSNENVVKNLYTKEGFNTVDTTLLRKK